MPDTTVINYRQPSYPSLPEAQKLKGPTNWTAWARKIKSIAGLLQRAGLRYVGRSLYLAGSVRRRSPKRKRGKGEGWGKGLI
jgi:hypothetical protein